MKRIGRVHAFIPDIQTKPGVTQKHLTWIGNYLAEKRPDVIVQIGDFADMPSLSSWDEGKGEMEGKRYLQDIEFTKDSMRKLLEPIKKVRSYNPKMILTLGNHEDRITRYVEQHPKLEGFMGLHDLEYEKDWEVYPFLRIVRIDNIEYTHYFTSGVKGNAVSTAKAILNTRHSSGVMGHNQTYQMEVHQKTGHIGIISGCCYLHEEKYLGPQMEGKAQRRQIIMLHEIRGDGIFDPVPVSLEFLKRKYS